MRITSYTMEVYNDRTIGLVKENAVNYKTEKSALKTPESIAKMFNDVFRLGYKAEEYLYILCLNAALHPIGVFEISHGGGNSAAFNIREIMQRVLLSGATGFVAIHNHPSGDLTVSNSDIKSTEKIFEASELMSVEFYDHIIIGGNCYYSMREGGYSESFN